MQLRRPEPYDSPRVLKRPDGRFSKLREASQVSFQVTSTSCTEPSRSSLLTSLCLLAPRGRRVKAALRPLLLLPMERRPNLSQALSARAETTSLVLTAVLILSLLQSRKGKRGERQGNSTSAPVAHYRSSTPPSTRRVARAWWSSY